MTKPTCIFPGCEAGISHENVTGLCRRHHHAVGLCKCGQCAAKNIAPATAPERPGVKTVEVAYPTSNSSVRGRAPVKVSRAPWE